MAPPRVRMDCCEDPLLVSYLPHEESDIWLSLGHRLQLMFVSMRSVTRALLRAGKCCRQAGCLCRAGRCSGCRGTVVGPSVVFGDPRGKTCWVYLPRLQSHDFAEGSTLPPGLWSACRGAGVLTFRGPRHPTHGCWFLGLHSILATTP